MGSEECNCEICDEVKWIRLSCSECGKKICEDCRDDNCVVGELCEECHMDKFIIKIEKQYKN